MTMEFYQGVLVGMGGWSLYLILLPLVNEIIESVRKAIRWEP